MWCFGVVYDKVSEANLCICVRMGGNGFGFWGGKEVKGVWKFEMRKCARVLGSEWFEI